MNILLINCSPVRNGATAEIIKIAHTFLEKNIPFTVFVLMIITFRSAKGVEPATKQQNAFKRMMYKKLLQNWSGRIVSSASLLLIGQMFPVSSRHLLTAVHHGAIPTNHMQKSAAAKKVTLLHCALVQIRKNVIELLRVLSTFMVIWKLFLAET